MPATSDAAANNKAAGEDAKVPVRPPREAPAEFVDLRNLVALALADIVVHVGAGALVCDLGEAEVGNFRATANTPRFIPQEFYPLALLVARHRGNLGADPSVGEERVHMASNLLCRLPTQLFGNVLQCAGTEISAVGDLADDGIFAQPAGWLGAGRAHLASVLIAVRGRVAAVGGDLLRWPVVADDAVTGT
ncbi:hypothetical protein ACTXG5_27335 [Mycobacterium sp. Dal123C01]|uniref:hypothetical protein n=1 Tax=Mycobacterium sp. Dal123C01 TaxID=3457577 RepID=UPI00403E73DD